MSEADRSTEHHHKCQQDGGDNDDSPPHQQSVFGELAFAYTDKELEDRSDYDRGWQNGYDNRRS